jgi:hypothetical protein
MWQSKSRRLPEILSRCLAFDLGVDPRECYDSGDNMPETMDPNQVSRPPTTYQLLVDRSFRGLCQLFAWLSALLVVFIVVRIATVAWPAIRQHGLGFLTGTTWDPNTGQYAILPEVWGTLYTNWGLCLRC